MYIDGRYYNVIGRLKSGSYACVSHGSFNNIKFFRSEKNCIKYYNEFGNASFILLIKNGKNLYRALIEKKHLLYDVSDYLWGVIED